MEPNKNEHSNQTKTIRTGADLLIQSLMDNDVDVIFGYPGGAVLPIFDSLYEMNPSFKNYLCRHEQGLIHAAEGYARVTGKTGVVLATSGPGITNLLTGIADAMLDSLPFSRHRWASLLGSDWNGWLPRSGCYRSNNPYLKAQLSNKKCRRHTAHNE